jgi:hypothetical protein
LFAGDEREDVGGGRSQRCKEEDDGDHCFHAGSLHEEKGRGKREAASEEGNEVEPERTENSLFQNPKPYIQAGDSVAFSPESLGLSGCGTARLWDFGDGQTSTDCDVSHVFSNCGPHAVSLTLRAVT